MIKKILGIAIVFSIILLVCSCKNDETPSRDFLSLDEAYSQELLSVSDLEAISFYYNGTVPRDEYTPKPRIPNTLSVDTIHQIGLIYLHNLQKNIKEATLADIRVTEYYGTYGKCVVVEVWDDLVDYDLNHEPEYYIGGVLFTNYSAREFHVYINESEQLSIR